MIQAGMIVQLHTAYGKYRDHENFQVADGMSKNLRTLFACDAAKT